MFGLYLVRRRGAYYREQGGGRPEDQSQGSQIMDLSSSRMLLPCSSITALSDLVRRREPAFQVVFVHLFITITMRYCAM